MRAPSQFLFDAVDDLSKMYLSERWTGSIKFRCLLVHALSTGLFLDKTCTHKVDTCDYLGVSPSHPPYVVHLFLDPEKYGKPSLPGEPISKNPHWMQLKDALELAAHTSGSPIVMCNGGMDYRRFKCKKLCNRVYKPKLGKKDGAPRQDDCINMDKGGRHQDGRSQSKRTRTTQALTSEKLCPFGFTVKWNHFGFYITLVNKAGCSNHEKITLRATYLNWRCQCNSSLKQKKTFFNLCWMHALDPLLVVIIFSSNWASSSQRLK
jgi:hypothetical protein